METKEILYDAEAKQSVTLATVLGGEAFEIKFSFEPISDEQAISFVESAEDGDSAGLFTKLLAGADGVEVDEGDKLDLPALCQAIPDQDKRFVIDGAIMGTRLIPAAKAKKKLNLRHLPEVASYQLAVYFNGQEVITKHEMIPGTAQHDKVLREFELLKFPVKFGDHEIKSYGDGLVKLYDALHCKSTGYAGRVPAHHKMLVIAAHLRGQRQIVMGK